MSKKSYTLFALLVVLAMVFSACGKKAEPTAKPVEPTKAAEVKATEVKVEPTVAPVEPVTTGKTQVRWFVGLGTGTDPEQQKIQQEVVDEFNKSQDKIELVLEVVAYNAARDTLATQIAAGNGPDIVGPVGWSGSNAFKGQWLDMAPLIEKTKYDTTVFNQALVKFYQTDEGTVGLPFAVFPAMVFYQKGMFDEAGLAYPPAKYGDKYTLDGKEVEWNYETLTQVAKLLTIDKNGKNATEDGFDATAIVQYGYVPQYQSPPHIGAFWGAGLPTMSADGKTVEIPEQWVAAWQWYYDGMWGKQPFIPVGTVVQSAEYGTGNPFDSGKVAMAITHMWYTCCISNAGTNWDLGALPSYNGEVHGRVDADTLRIWKGTKNPDAAFEVLSYLIGPGSLKLLATYGGMPGRTADQDAFFATKAEQFPFVTNWDVVKAGLSYPDVPSAEGYMPNWNKAWDRIDNFGKLMAADGKIDFKAEVDKLIADLTAIFNEK